MAPGRLVLNSDGKVHHGRIRSRHVSPGTKGTEPDLDVNCVPSLERSRSGEFHTYRAHRRREMHRVAVIEEDMRQEEATAKLQAAIEKVLAESTM